MQDCPGHLFNKIFRILGDVTGETFGAGLLTFQVVTALDCQCPASCPVRQEEAGNHSVCSATHVCPCDLCVLLLGCET